MGIVLCNQIRSSIFSSHGNYSASHDDPFFFVVVVVARTLLDPSRSVIGNSHPLRVIRRDVHQRRLSAINNS